MKRKPNKKQLAVIEYLVSKYGNVTRSYYLHNLVSNASINRKNKANTYTIEIGQRIFDITTGGKIN